MKNILGELDGSSTADTSANGSKITPIPVKSMRKLATEKDIEMKKYMEKFGKKNTARKSEVDGEVDLINVEFFTR